MKQATVKEGGYLEWFAEYDGISFLIWKSYLWNDKGRWDYYYVVTNDDKGIHYQQLVRSAMSPELATRLCKKAIKSINIKNKRL